MTQKEFFEIFTNACTMLSIAYNIDFLDKKSVEFMKAKMIYQYALEDNYSINEFTAMIKSFIKNNKWHNFSVADVLRYDRPKLYNESWKKAEMQKDVNCIQHMECFEVRLGNNKVVDLYRYYDINNAVINNPDIRIKNEKWDRGKHYVHQYKNDNNSKTVNLSFTAEDYHNKYFSLLNDYNELFLVKQQLIKEVSMLKEELRQKNESRA